MGAAERAKIGTIGWRDLTVRDAEGLRDFYERVVGWTSSRVEMGGYSDFSMSPPGADEPVAGVCHARGTNADLPAQWLMYIVVEDVVLSAARCVELGGKVLSGPRPVSGGSFCVMQDPAGAVCAQYQYE